LEAKISHYLSMLGKNENLLRALDEWNKDKDEHFLEQLELRIQNDYNNYLEGRKEATKTRNVSSEEKIDLVRSILQVQFGEDFGSISAHFPPFYFQDLVAFGIENNIPEAVRLGEHMMSTVGHKMPRDMAMAVKNYLLHHS